MGFELSDDNNNITPSTSRKVAASEHKGCNGPNSLLLQRLSDNLIHETKDFIELRGSPSLVGRGIANPQDFSLFSHYLLAQKKRNIRQIMCYAQRYRDVLETGDASPLVNLSSGALRRHAMEALTVYAKYDGSYEKWCQIRKRYSLRWTNGDESFQALQRFFNPALTLEVMLHKIRNMIQVLPKSMAAVVRHAVMTGLRPAEAVESVKLLKMQKWKNPEMQSVQYYNPERQCLEHYKFPRQFLRATKKAFISYITKEQLSGIALLGPETPGYDAIRSACKRRKIDMDMRLCRKVHRSWLHSHGVTAEEVDFLQGRVSPSVFSRHYLTPENSLRTRVLEALEKLSSQLVNPKIEGTK